MISSQAFTLSLKVLRILGSLEIHLHHPLPQMRCEGQESTAGPESSLGVSLQALEKKPSLFSLDLLYTALYMA